MTALSWPQSSTSTGADMDGAPTEDATLVDGLADLAHSASHTEIQTFER
jgi:hypothetical protein